MDSTPRNGQRAVDNSKLDSLKPRLRWKVRRKRGGLQERNEDEPFIGEDEGEE